MIISGGVVYTAMDRLQDILIPFLLAVALSYLLGPLVDLLSCRGAEHSIRFPRILAVMISFCVGVGIIVCVGLVLLKALTTFQERSDTYAGRVEELVGNVFETVAEVQRVTGSTTQPRHPNHTMAKEAEEMVESFLKDVSLTDTILNLLGTAAHILEDTLYIVLFLVFMLAHASDRGPRDRVKQRVERQIFIYIRGKSGISAFVASMHALVLFSVGLQGLWLPFGVLTFFLNFIPNVGGLGAVLLPMPLIALDPTFNSLMTTIAFIIPFSVMIFAKDVLEPKILGHATDLSPVAILLAILMFGSVWGIVGMVLAIPLTAVIRINLEAMAHPVPKMMARCLSGREAESFGLHWEVLTTATASHLIELDYPKLLEAVQEKAAAQHDTLSFSQADFDSFGIDGELTEDCYVTVDVPRGMGRPPQRKHFRPYLPHSSPSTLSKKTPVNSAGLV